LKNCSSLFVVPPYYVKDHPIVVGVSMVSVGLPSTGLDMNFYIPSKLPFLGGDDGMVKIGATLAVYPPRIDNLEPLTTSGDQLPIA